MNAPPDWLSIAQRFLDELIPGPTGSRGGIRNNTLCSVAGRLRFEGYERETIEAVLIEVNRRQCVPPLRQSAVRNIAKWIATRPAGPGAGSVPRRQFEAARDMLVELALCFVSFPWRGRGAATDGDVVRALLQIAWDCGRLTFSASERRIAECAEVGRPAVRRALTKSESVRKWVRRLRRQGGLTRSSRWQLRRPAGVRQSDTSNAGEAALRLLVLDRRTGDVWRHGGLGKAARNVWSALPAQASQSAASARDLACVSNVSVRTAQRALAKLALHGLAVRDDAGWRRGAVELEHIAPVLRSFGAGDRQRQQHQHERESYQENRARRGRLLVAPADITVPP